MEKLTYSQAYDKIIQAYFRDEIKPMDAKFCFCGTLANGKSWLKSLYTKKEHNYSGKEYGKMECALLSPLIEIGVEKTDPKNRGGWFVFDEDWLSVQQGYEDLLFAGMCAALEVLKQIHKERGEDVDGVPEFTKRELVK